MAMTTVSDSSSDSDDPSAAEWPASDDESLAPPQPGPHAQSWLPPTVPPATLESRATAAGIAAVSDGDDDGDGEKLAAALDAADSGGLATAALGLSVEDELRLQRLGAQLRAALEPAARRQSDGTPQTSIKTLLAANPIELAFFCGEKVEGLRLLGRPLLATAT